MALAVSNHQPDHLVTVFAGVDEHATAQVFEYTKPYPPSSPAIALFKDGTLVHFVERHQIKGVPPEMIATDLQDALKAYCQLIAVA
jgi:putative YphP/YqiW family bacilliredoxin